MTKYHINPETGNPGLCTASKRGCKYGSNIEHYSSESEARIAFEKNSESEYVNSFSKEEYIDSNEVYENKDHTISYNMDSAQKEFKENIQGKFFKLETDKTEEPGILLEKLFGKKADSLSEADLGKVELKTQKKSRTDRLITLSKISMKNSQNLKDNFFPNSNFNKVVNTRKWTAIGDYYYRLKVDRNTKNVTVMVANSKAEMISKGSQFSWSFNDLNEKVDNKLSKIAVGTYELQESDGRRAVKYDELYSGGFTRESFIDSVENSTVQVEFRKRNDSFSAVFKSKLEDFADHDQP